MHTSNGKSVEQNTSGEKPVKVPHFGYFSATGADFDMQYTCVSNSSHLTSVFKISVLEKINSSLWLLLCESKKFSYTSLYDRHREESIVLGWTIK